MFWNRRAERVLSKVDNWGPGEGPGGSLGGASADGSMGGLGGSMGGNTGLGGSMGSQFGFVDPESDTAFGGFGNAAGLAAGEGADSLGDMIGNLVSMGVLTADQAMSIAEHSNLGHMDLADINTSMAISSMSPVLANALALVGIPVDSSLTIAGHLAAFTGQGMLGQGSVPDPGDQAGPGYTTPPNNSVGNILGNQGIVGGENTPTPPPLDPRTQSTQGLASTLNSIGLFQPQAPPQQNQQGGIMPSVGRILPPQQNQQGLGNKQTQPVPQPQQNTAGLNSFRSMSPVDFTFGQGQQPPRQAPPQQNVGGLLAQNPQANPNFF